MMRDAGVPGMSVAVVRHDRVLFTAALGWADLTGPVPVTTRTSFLWFSMSKIVTATAAARLSDEGRLDLDAPVGEYLAWPRRPAARQPTTRQLLTHTAGLGNPMPLRWVHPPDQAAPDQEEMLRRTLHRRRIFRYEPGQRAQYSNVGYLAAAQVIATAAGVPFPRYVAQAVLRPAGMLATGFGYRPGVPAATGYVRAPRIAGPLLRMALPDVVGDRHGRYLALRPFLVDGAGYGGLVGDVMDAARLVRLHLGDGCLDGQRVLTAETARGMRRIVASGTRFEHALGWFRRPTGEDRAHLEHFGAGAGFWNVMRLYPADDLGVVVMSNSTASYRFAPVFAYLSGLAWP